MTKLYWHRWDTRRGVSFYLRPEPQTRPFTVRPLDDRDVASVHSFLSATLRQGKLVRRWEYIVQGRWGHVGSPIRARRLAERYIDRCNVISDPEFIAPPRRAVKFVKNALMVGGK